MNVANSKAGPNGKLVYYWNEIDESNEDLFGQKAARLAIAKKQGVPTPPFFAITTRGVRQILENKRIPDPLHGEIKHNRALLEKETGRSFIDPSRPLITAVRSGDPFSMAGAMFSYLNVGINKNTVPALVDLYRDEAAILHMYLDSVVDHGFMVENQSREDLAEVLDGLRRLPTKVESLETLIALAKEKVVSFPEDPVAHITDAIQAVAVSWENFATRAFLEEMEVEKDLYPSIFVQQMVFGNLVNSAFLAFCTHNPISGQSHLFGDFALGTEGRRMMRGIGPKRQDVRKLVEAFPEIAAQLDKSVAQLETLFRRPQDIEAIIERNRLHFVQIMDAHLSPAARRSIRNEFREQGLLKRDENIPPIPGIQRTRVIETSKLAPDVDLIPIASGKPIHPGVVEGHLALSVDDAIRLGMRLGKKTILLLGEPDERVLPLLLKRQIEGFAAMYASTHDAAAAMVSHVPAVMGVSGHTEGSNYLICFDGTKIQAGQRIILDGTRGHFYEASESTKVLIIEDKPILITNHDLSGYEIERETREKYRDISYEDLINLHAKFVGKIEHISGSKRVSQMPGQSANAVKYVELELITHYVHIMINEKADALGITFREAQLDVAVADGTLDRVPGLEHKEIVLERSKGNIILILASEVFYEYETIESIAYSEEEISELMSSLKNAEIPANLYVKQTKLSRHTQSISTTCLEFPAEYLEKVVVHLQLFDVL